MKITVSEAAKLMQVSPSVVRMGLRQGAYTFGTAYKNETRWTYIIYPEKFKECFSLSE